MDHETKDDAAAPVGGIEMRWVELAVALLICLGGAVVIFDSMRIGAKWGSDGPQSGYFPFLTGTCLTLAGAWVVISTIARWKSLAGKVFVDWPSLKPVLSMLLPTIAFVLAIKFIGIYVASAIFIGAFMVWKGHYGWRMTCAVGAGVPIAMFVLFEIWFLVPLPKGPLERLLGY
jgi:hypothetical protein